MLRVIGTFLLAGVLAVLLSASSGAGSVNVGPKKCENCHQDESKVWQGSLHAKSFKKIHKHKTAKKILKSVGEKRMKKSAICANCHYTTVEKKKGKLKPIAGPSCESCHGKASEWISVHNAKGEDKALRIKNSVSAGMIRPEMLFEVAANCMSCHGLENKNLSGEHVAAMLDNGHPFNPNYELVAYSQGSIRHRFYPPTVTENKTMTKAEMAHLYVVGQAAAFVSATKAIKKTSHVQYVEGQKMRIAKAKTVLSKISEASALLASPSSAAGKAFARAIKNKDLTSIVGAELPKKFK